MCNRKQEHDELRGRFTNWLEVVIFRARLNYLKKAETELMAVPWDEVQGTTAEPQAERNAFGVTSSDSFDFGEESLALAFALLSPARRKVLTMLFVLDMAPEEVAARLGCTTQNVYNQRSLAIKHLRSILEGGDRHDK